MTTNELTQAYAQLPQQEKLLFASLVAADQMRCQAEFSAALSRRHRDMDEGKKWSHESVRNLHEKLEQQGL